jgi:hypothetical protein
MENHAKYGDSIYFHDDGSLFVNLFIASELTWKAKGLKVRQETKFPIEDTTTLTLWCEKPVKLVIKVRCPGWIAGPMQVKINGKASKVKAKPGSYVVLNRKWQDGDKIEITLPMSLRLEAMPDNPQRAAIFYGPIVLAGDLGPIEREATASPAVDDFDNPVLVTQGRPPDDWLIRMEDRPLGFETYNVGRPHDVPLIPFYEMHHRRYGVYWDFLTQAQWEKHYYDFLAEIKRLKELDARTIDILKPGEPASEKEHKLSGERMESTESNGRKCCQATDAGAISFEMKIMPDQPVELLCTYRGSDFRPRTFDVLIDGRKIATQAENSPDRLNSFFEVTYPIPAELTKGKEKVTVTLQARPGFWVGPLFGCRTLKKDE